MEIVTCVHKYIIVWTTNHVYINNKLVTVLTKVRKILASHAHVLSQSQLQNYFILKNSIFWDVTPCSLLKANRRFGGTYSWKRSIKVIRISDISDCNSAFTLVPCSAYSTLKMKAMIYSETSVVLNGLYGVIPQMIVVFITTAVRTLNPTYFILFRLCVCLYVYQARLAAIS
jgi:hypothetical protein